MPNTRDAAVMSARRQVGIDGGTEAEKDAAAARALGESLAQTASEAEEPQWLVTAVKHATSTGDITARIEALWDTQERAIDYAREWLWAPHQFKYMERHGFVVFNIVDGDVEYTYTITIRQLGSPPEPEPQPQPQPWEPPPTRNDCLVYVLGLALTLAKEPLQGLCRLLHDNTEKMTGGTH